MGFTWCVRTHRARDMVSVCAIWLLPVRVVCLCLYIYLYKYKLLAGRALSLRLLREMRPVAEPLVQPSCKARARVAQVGNDGHMHTDYL